MSRFQLKRLMLFVWMFMPVAGVTALTAQNTPTLYATFRVATLDNGFLIPSLADVVSEKWEGLFPLSGNSAQIGNRIFRVIPESEPLRDGGLVALQAADGRYLSYNRGFRFVSANEPGNSEMFRIARYNARQRADIVSQQNAARNKAAANADSALDSDDAGH